jgi:hypothetical protein
MSGFYPLNQPFDSGKTRNRGRMSQKPSKRGHKLIAFKAFFDTDRDILDWWEGMQEGERSDVIRELLRGYVKGLPLYEARRPKVAVDGSMVLQMRDDTAWIRDALNDMPAYLEALLGRIALSNPVVPISQPPPMPVRNDTDLPDEALARRKAKMGKTVW